MENGFPLDLFKAFVKKTPTGVYIWKINDPEDVEACSIEFINDAASKGAEADLKQYVGKSVGDSFPGIGETLMPTVFRAATKTGEKQRIISFLYGNKNIPENNFRVELIPLSEEYIAVMFINISAQIKAEEKLHEKLDELERITEIMTGRELKMVELKEEIDRLKGN
jgi:hypothetical protein